MKISKRKYNVKGKVKREGKERGLDLEVEAESRRDAGWEAFRKTLPDLLSGRVDDFEVIGEAVEIQT